MTASNEISVTMPIDSRFVATSRVVAASVAAELDFTVDEIEDLRVGANEIVTFLLEWAEDHGGECVRIRYSVADGRIDIVAEVEGADAGDAGDELDPLARQILGAVVDEYSINGSSAHITKLRNPA